MVGGPDTARVAVIGSGPAGVYTAQALTDPADRRSGAGRRLRPAAGALRPGAVRRRTRPSEDQVDHRATAAR